MAPSDWLTDGPKTSRISVVLAHGAGAPMDTPFMNAIADGLAAANLFVIRFEFPYMMLRRTTGRRRGPDRPAVLRQAWHQVVQDLGTPANLIIGGKSMGGRMASEIAEEANVGGVVCLGYPFHPPGRPEKLRTAHLADLTRPALILQGERDTFGTPTEIAGYQLSGSIKVEWLPDGDHSFKPRKASGHTLEENMERAISTIVEFARAL